MECLRFFFYFFAIIAFPCTLQNVSAESASLQQLDVMVGNSDEYAKTIVSLHAAQNAVGFGADDHAKITSALATVKETIATARALMEDEQTLQAGTELMKAANTAFREVKGHIAERKLQHDTGHGVRGLMIQEDEKRGMDVARQLYEAVS
jgi:hypothetical protein